MFIRCLLVLLAGTHVAAAKCKCLTADSSETSLWPNRAIQAKATAPPLPTNSPIGYVYPLGANSCPPLNASVAVYPICELGVAPAYSIKATNADDVAAGIKFAKEHNVRLVVKLTGHDLEHRSQGYGSLSIWVRSIQNGLKLQDKFTSADGSCNSDWTGSAVQINGGYLWVDIYKFAGDRGYHVVGGADRTVGTIGGYLQGGGHGALSHFHGLATDQVLEYQVVLASGELVVANACQNTDLFTALRGGGGGTFGVVISATIKAYKDQPVLLHNLEVIALPDDSFEDNVNELYKVTTDILSEYPGLSDAGWAGTAWFTVGEGLAYYGHPFLSLLEDNSTAAVDKAKKAMEDKILSKLTKYENGATLKIESQWKQYNSFRDYIFLPPFNPIPAGGTSIMSSWLFDRKSLESPSGNTTQLLQTLNSGNDNIPLMTPGGGATLFNLVAGGKVLDEVPHTSVSPAWRRAYLLVEQIDTWPKNWGPEAIKEKIDRATHTKLKAMKDFSPGMGTYSNEADPYDPDWKQSWWGDNYDFLLSVKEKYDPDRVFWTWKSVGNDGWGEVKGGGLYGPLCETGTSAN
ncbi:isoamyl alcohol oxidase [Penicillium chermesinum]|nr:isoamyl alcohol oxidase [Penicillium chermesinum]